jgi:hypothetical protein
MLEPGIRQLLLDLAGAEVEVEDRWREGTDRGAIYPGECFFRAARYVTHRARFLADGVWLVHGTNSMSIDRHAWAELPGGVVFDAVLQRFYSKIGYYDATVARPWYKYTTDAAAIIPLHLPLFPDGTALYGDWHKPLGLPWVTPDCPLEVDQERAIAALTAQGHFPPSPEKLRRRKR